MAAFTEKVLGVCDRAEKLTLWAVPVWAVEGVKAGLG